MVVGEGAGSKADKAAELGVRVLPAEKFAALLQAHTAGDSDTVAEILAGQRFAVSSGPGGLDTVVELNVTGVQHGYRFDRGRHEDGGQFAGAHPAGALGGVTRTVLWAGTRWGTRPIPGYQAIRYVPMKPTNTAASRSLPSVP